VGKAVATWVVEKEALAMKGRAVAEEGERVTARPSMAEIWEGASGAVPPAEMEAWTVVLGATAGQCRDRTQTGRSHIGRTNFPDMGAVGSHDHWF
jgi:hypothetical protein